MEARILEETLSSYSSMMSSVKVRWVAALMHHPVTTVTLA
jgi:hypothetical protein